MPVAKTVLLIEDSADDSFFFERALRRAGLSHSVITISTGAEALLYLAGADRYADRAQYPLPALMFIDLHLPDMNGFDLLEQVRRDFSRQQLLLVVLTGAQELSAIRRAYALGADSFIVKPPRPEDFTNLALGFPNHL